MTLLVFLSNVMYRCVAVFDLSLDDRDASEFVRQGVKKVPKLGFGV